MLSGHYVEEAGRASLRFAFDRLAVDQVVSVIDRDNAMSIRVAEKIGETYQRTEYLHDKDQDVYTISRSAWEMRTGS